MEPEEGSQDDAEKGEKPTKRQKSNDGQKGKEKKTTAPVSSLTGPKTRSQVKHQ